MRILLLLSLLFASNTAISQEYRERFGFILASIADIDIGWIRPYTIPASTKAKQLGNRSYSAWQIRRTEQFMQWMQQSYTPKGCLGDVANFQNYIPAFSGTNSRQGNAISKQAAALPHLYGALSKMYMFLKKDAQGRFIPQNTLSDDWFIEANQLQYISLPVSFISGEDEYYFLFPDLTSNPTGYDPADKAHATLMGFDTHKNLEGYRHFYIPAAIPGAASQYVVIMSKQNELPFDRVTIGEFFAQVEKQLPFWQSVTPVSSGNFARAVQNLDRLKVKYKPRWKEIALIEPSAASFTLTDLVNATGSSNDIFDDLDIYGKPAGSTRFPLLKVNSKAKEACKKDQPQWLVVRWDVGLRNEPYFNHLHESILNNFNFRYLYDAMFDTSKIAGRPYQPLRSPSAKIAVAVSEASTASKKIKEDNSVLFFDDFSITPVGNKPVGWQTKISNGGTAVVNKRIGLEGNWLEMNGQNAAIKLSDKLIPKDFTLSYDVVVGQHFTWGAKGLTMYLMAGAANNNNNYLKVKLRPGSNGGNGEMEVEVKFPSQAGFASGSKWYAVKSFSNDKVNNKVTISITKAGEQVLIFADGSKIAEYDKGIPGLQNFSAITFDCSGNSAEVDRYYISNVKISKM